MTELQPKPILLTWNMPKGAWVSSFRSIGPKATTPHEQAKEHKLPFAIARNADYDPSRMYLLTSEPVPISHSGWSCDGQWEWDDAPIRMKSRLFQQLINTHLYKKKKQQLGYDWIIEGPEEVKSGDGRNSTVWLCANFQYIGIEGKDGMTVEISRKVQATKSIWEEMEDGIYGLNSETKEVRVKVKDSNDSSKMMSRKLVKISEMDLNDSAWEGSNMTLAEYWNKDEERYTEEQASNIPVILVNRKSGEKPSRYPADQVYRVMSMENWPDEVRQHLSKYLNLTSEKYLSLVQKGMGWLRLWEINNSSVQLDFGWHGEFEVQHSDSRQILKLQNGNNFLSSNWRWFDNVRNFESLHGRPPPSIDAYYVVPPGHENHHGDLVMHAKQTFGQIPGWKERVVHHELRIIPADSKAKADLFIETMINEISSEKRSVVVYSALLPKTHKPEVDLYKSLKYALDEAGMVHQNFSIGSKYSLKKKPDSAAGQVNVLQMLLKHGFLPVPYTCSIGNVDVVCALDVGRIGPNKSVTAFAVSITRTGQLWGTTPKGEPQTGETISEDAIRRTIKGIIKRNQIENESTPSRILVIRDGNTPRRELESIRKIALEYNDLDVDICWVSVRKSGAPRLLNFVDGKVVNELPVKGHWLSYGERSAWIWTTGSPELKEGRPGIPQGSAFTIEINFQDNPLAIEEVSQLMISHAHASQMTPWSSTRLPFVHHLADKMAKAMANSEIPLNQNGRKFTAA